MYTLIRHTISGVEKQYLGITTNSTGYFPYTAPSAPRDVRVTQLNVSHVEVMWSLLPPEESRGVILNYTLTYTNGPDTRKTISVPPTQNRAVLSELKPGEYYLMYIFASTSAGMGNSTVTTTSLPVDNISGELKLKGLFISIEYTYC